MIHENKCLQSPLTLKKCLWKIGSWYYKWPSTIGTSPCNLMLLTDVVLYTLFATNIADYRFVLSVFPLPFFTSSTFPTRLVMK